MSTLNPQSADSEDYPPLSALNQMLYCERRCALLRIERVWVDNQHTIGGTLDHLQAHEVAQRKRTGRRVVSGLRLVSHSLRLTGVADIVEFHNQEQGLPDIPFPIEYKRGKRKRWDNDDVQLCAQAICLEEMLGVPVPAGAIYHIKSRARRDLSFTPELRALTCQTANRLHALIQAGQIPLPELKPRCRGCSLKSICLPEIFSQPARIVRLNSQLFQAKYSDP